MDNKIKKTRVKIPSTQYDGSVKRQKQWFKKRGIKCVGEGGYPMYSMGRLIALQVMELRKRRDIMSIDKKFNPAMGRFYGSWRMKIVLNNMKVLCPYYIEIKKSVSKHNVKAGITDLNPIGEHSYIPKPISCQQHWFYCNNVLGFRKESDLSFYLLKNGHLLA